MDNFLPKRITDIPYKLKKRRSPRRLIYWFFYCVLAAIVVGSFALFSLIIFFNVGLPGIDELKNISISQNTQILDRKGEILHNIQGEENRKYVAIADISPHLIKATIAIEDDQFYAHPGFDLPAIAKSVVGEIFGIGGRRGGSTITQQFVKNYFLSRERTYSRKLKELILAVKIERALSKDEILELYLNKIPYGNNAYGIQQAAKVYFNKDAKDLDLSESAILAALPQAPSYYSPYGPRRYTGLEKQFSVEDLAARPIKAMTDLEENEYIRGLLGKTYELADGSKVYLLGRSDLVLRRMRDLSLVNEEEFTAAEKNLATAIEFTPHAQSFTAPHFIFYVREYLEKKYGKEIVEQGGLKVTTTLDREWQLKAEELVKKQAEINRANYDADNAALLATNPRTGEILAMVGSADFFNKEINGQVNITDRELQPGSSFKPFVYATAFLNRYSPATAVYDTPTKFGLSEQSMQNFDGKFYGPMSLRSALALSRNIPAVKTLYLAGGETAVVAQARAMGLESLKDDGSYGVSLALGTGKVKLTELLTGYGVFANNGKKVPLTPILKVENAAGEILEEWREPNSEQVLDEQVAYLINNVLSDPAMHLGSRLRISGQTIATKTGTANKKTTEGKILPSNGWTIGYTPSLVVGTWAGNTNGHAMKANASGYSNAAPIFNEFLQFALKDKPAEPFSIPAGIKHLTVSSASGLLPSPDTPPNQVRSEVFASFAVPVDADDRFYKVNIDKMSQRIATEHTPSYLVETRYYRVHKDALDNEQWQEGIASFVANQRLKAPDDPDYQPFPTETDNIHNPTNAAKAPTITILSPVESSNLKAGFIPVEVEIKNGNSIESVEFFMNEQKQFTTKDSPYNGSVRIHPKTASGTSFKIQAIVTDIFGYRSEHVISVRVE